MNEIIFESKLRGLLKEFRAKLTADEMEEVISKVIFEGRRSGE